MISVAVMIPELNKTRRFVAHDDATCDATLAKPGYGDPATRIVVRNVVPPQAAAAPSTIQWTHPSPNPTVIANGADIVVRHPAVENHEIMISVFEVIEPENAEAPIVEACTVGGRSTLPQFMIRRLTPTDTSIKNVSGSLKTVFINVLTR